MDFITSISFSSHIIHSAMMACIFGVQIFMIYLALHKYAKTRDARWFFFILAGLISSVYFFFHTLVVPGFVIFSEALFDIFEHYGLFLAGMALSVGIAWNGKAGERLYSLRKKILDGWIVGNLSVIAILMFWPKLQDILYSWVDYATGISGILLLVASAFFFRHFSVSRERIDMSVASGLLVLTGSTVVPFFYEEWNLLWWSNHVLFLLGNTMMLVGFIVDRWWVGRRDDALEEIPFYHQVKFKFAILILTLTVIPLSLLGIYGSFIAEQSLRQQAIQNLEYLAASSSAQVSSLTHVFESTATDFSSDWLIRRLSEDISLIPEETQGYVDTLNQHLVRNKLPTHRYLIGVNILDTHGKVVASTDDVEIGKDESLDEYFVKGLQLPYGNAIIADYGASSHFRTDEPLIATAAPLFSLDNSRATGIIVTYFKLESIALLLNREVRQGDTLDTYLVDENNLLISKSRFLEKDAILSRTIDTEPIGSCHDGRDTSGVWENWRGEVVYGSSVCLADLPFRWTLVVEINETEVIAPADAFRELILIAVALLAVTVIFIALISANGMVGTLEALSRFAKKINQGKLDGDVDVNSSDEVGMLAQNLNLMRQTIKARADDLEETNASLMKADQDLKANIADIENSKKAVMNLFEDIKESEEQLRKQADELVSVNIRIEEEKERAESILRFLQSIDEQVYVVDRERKIIFINASASALVGLDHEQILGTHMSEHFIYEGADGKRYLPTRKVLADQRAHVFPDRTLVKIRGKSIAVSGTASPIFDDKKKLVGVVVVFQDVTKRYELEQMKDSFLSVAAHQLRTPLGSMRWSMELLIADDFGKLPKAAKEAVQQLYDNSQRMTVLVNDLLDISRIEQNRGTEEKKLVSIGGIVKAVLSQLQSEADKRNIKIRVSVPEEPLPDILVSPKHVHEALENLLSNAIKYNRDNGTVTIKIIKKEKYLELTVTDTGIGIPKNDYSKIFSKFFRASNAVLQETDGSGLGLSVVKSYLEESGAKVSFESEENVGTTFLVEFPLDPTAGIS